MKKFFTVLLTLATLIVGVSQSSAGSSTISVSTLFTPLHTYFIDPAGHDSCNGLGTSTGTTNPCAWATPNHAVVCGDIIVGPAGNYNNDMSTWGTVSNCPSTSGGIDGTGGIYAAVLLCGAADLGNSSSGGCRVNCATAPCNPPGGNDVTTGIAISAASWAISGWNITCNGTVRCIGVQLASCGSGAAGTNFKYQMVLNSLIYNNGSAIDTQDCGNGRGPDYGAIVGNIVQNSVLYYDSGFQVCLSSIDLTPGTGAADTDTTKTHWLVHNNYMINNIHTSTCLTLYDAGSFMIDEPDLNSQQGHLIHSNNVSVHATRYCTNITQTNNATHPTIRMYNNTCFDHWFGDSTVNSTIASMYLGNYAEVFKEYFWNNAVYEPHAHNTTGTSVDDIYPMIKATPTGATSQAGTEVVSGGQNVLTGSMTTCDANLTPNCDSTHSYGSPDGVGFTASVNTYPGSNFLKNTSDLLTNHLGVPNCTGFTSTTACLGWNVATQTATANSFIDDITISCTGCSGKGFQPVGLGCVAAGSPANVSATLANQVANDYPPYLKGLVRLQWTGTQVNQVADLAYGVPCGM